MIVYRTAGVWGAGLGANLSPAQVDGNFFDLDGRVSSLEQNPPQAVSIDHFTVSGTDLTIWLTDGTVQGPFTLPSATWRWTGVWRPNIVYSQNDTFSVNGALYLVLEPHTSPAAFDPLFTVGTDPAYAVLIATPALPYDIGFFYPLGIPSDSSVLAQAVVTRDAAIPANFARSVAFLRTACSEPLSFPIVINETPVGEIQFAVDRFLEDGGPGQFGVFVQTTSETIELARFDRIQILAPFVSAGPDATAAGLSVTIAASTVGFGGSGSGGGAHALEDDTDVEVTSPIDGQVLTYDALSGTWKNKTEVDTLSGLGDVQVTGVADGDVPTWDAASAKWKNRAPAGGGGSGTLAGDSDVQITSPADKDVLVYDLVLSKWKNIPLSEAYLTFSDVTTGNVSSTKHGFAPKSPADATKFLNGAATPDYAAVKDSDLSTSDVSTNNVSSTKHGFAPKSPADATKFLNGAATPDYAAVKDSDLSLSDITTNDVSTTKHGFVPKAPNDTAKFLRGDGSWAAIAGSYGYELARTATVNADFGTWVNQGSTAAVADESWGWTLSETTFQSGVALRMRVKNCLSLSGSWEAIARISRGYPGAIQFLTAGMCVRESGTSKVITCGFATSGTTGVERCEYDRWTNSTTYSSTPFVDGGYGAAYVWIKFTWDQAAGKYRWWTSADGRVWCPLGNPESKTTFFTTTFDQIGFFLNAQFGSPTIDKMSIGIASYSEG